MGTHRSEAAKDALLAELWRNVATGRTREAEELVKDVRQELNEVMHFVHNRTPVRVEFGLPTYLTLDGECLEMATEIPIDSVAVIPLIFYNAADEVVPGFAGGTVEVSTEDAEVITNDHTVTITPLGAEGAEFDVTYTNGELTTTESFILVAGAVEPPAEDQTPVRVAMDISEMSLVPKEAPAPVSGGSRRARRK